MLYDKNRTRCFPDRIYHPRDDDFNPCRLYLYGVYLHLKKSMFYGIHHDWSNVLCLLLCLTAYLLSLSNGLSNKSLFSLFQSESPFDYSERALLVFLLLSFIIKITNAYELMQNKAVIPV